MKDFMMKISFFSFFWKRNQDNSPVLFTSGSFYIAFFHKMVDCNRQCSHRNRHCFGHCRHILGFLYTDCFHNMHIIYWYIFIFWCDQCSFFNIKNIFKQSHQNIIHCFIWIHASLLRFLTPGRSLSVFVIFYYSVSLFEAQSIFTLIFLT